MEATSARRGAQQQQQQVMLLYQALFIMAAVSTATLGSGWRHTRFTVASVCIEMFAETSPTGFFSFFGGVLRRSRVAQSAIRENISVAAELESKLKL